MMLASIEGSIITAVVVGVVALIRWLGEKAAKQGNADEAARKSAPERTVIAARGQSEEERMRRFLEALGIPADSAEAHRPASPPTPPRPAQAKQPPPVPARRPPIVPPAKTLTPSRKATSPFPVSPVPFPARRPFSEDERPAPSLPVEKIHLAELKTPELPEFETISSRVMAVQDDQFGVSRLAPSSGEIHETAEVAETSEVKALFRSRQALKNAVILREVLGPPRGLQW